MSNVAHVDDDVAADGHRAAASGPPQRVGHSDNRRSAAAQHRRSASPRVWHIAAKSATSSENWASSPIGSPLTTAKPMPRAVRDRRGAVRAEVVALRRLHGERRQRVARRRVHQRPYPRADRPGCGRADVGHISTRPRAGDQHIAEQIESQERALPDPRCSITIAAVGMPRGDRTAEEDAARDQDDGRQDRQRPAADPRLPIGLWCRRSSNSQQTGSRRPAH